MKRKFTLSLLFLIGFIGKNYAQNFEWLNSFGYSNIQVITNVETDSQNNVYVAGYFKDSIDLDPSIGQAILYSLGEHDIFFAKYDSIGQVIWYKSINGTNNVYMNLNSLKLDSLGNIYIIGKFQGLVDVDPSLNSYIVSGPTVNFEHNLFYSKYDNNGNLISSFTIGEGSGNLTMYDNKIYNNYLYITGEFSGTHDFDPDTSTFFLSGSSDAFIAKYDLTGKFINAIKVNCESAGSFILHENKIIHFGTFKGNMDCDPSANVYTISSGSSTTKDIFINCLDTAFNFIWAKSIGSPNSNEYLDDIILEQSGSFIVSGGSNGVSDIDPGSSTFNIGSTGTKTIFFAKYDSTFNLIIAKDFISQPGDEAFASVFKKINNYIYTGIVFQGVLDFDPSSSGVELLTSSGYNDFALAKYDLNFNLLWTIQGGSSGWDYIWGLSKSKNNTIKFVGSFENSLTISNNQYISNGHYDAYLASIYEDSCSTFSLTIDSLLNITCVDSGFANSSVIGSNGNIQYQWNSIPPYIDSFAFFNNPGIYSLQVTDSIGCIRERSVLVNGPQTSGFDLNNNLQANNFRSGFTSNIWLDGFNDGCTPISGSLSLVLDPLVSFNFSFPSPDNISGDTLFWNFTDLIYDSTHITPMINVATLGQIGDTVCFDVMINPISGDADSSNNYKSYCFPVINGYDPNFKQVYPQGECIPNYVLNNESLTYTIHFQNTGNADAINIHLLDTLDANLDLNTLRVIGNSHYVITEILPGNVMKFRFDNINLPDSTSDEPNSHGYVIYEVYPNIGTPPSTLIENTAHIYFDFNPAIVTNTTQNTLVDSIPVFTTTENVSICYNSEYTMPNGTIFNNVTSNFSYQSNLWMVDGCDSIITTNITVLPMIDTGVHYVNFAVEADISGMNYQWYDCQTNQPIIGETGQLFNPIIPGDFYVVISDGACSDTSACYVAGTIGINDYLFSLIKVFPNPAKGNLYIELPEEMINTKICITDLQGKIIQSLNGNTKLNRINISSLSDGMYFIQVSSEIGKITYKFIKE